jgi:hypothetical protein
MKCTKCKNSIPERRANLGYKECINCSTIESYSCIDVVYHKTGNTLEIVDKETAARINKLAHRSGFGVMRGIIGSKSRGSEFSLSVPKFEEPIIETQENFNIVGESATNILDEQGIEHAIKYITSAYSLRTISLSQMNKLYSILHKLNSDIKKPPVKLSHNPYARSEPRFEKSEVSDDVNWVFRNWKK